MRSSEKKKKRETVYVSIGKKKDENVEKDRLPRVRRPMLSYKGESEVR